MKRFWVTLDAIACSEVDGQNHGHLQAIREIVGEVVFHCLLEVLQHYQTLLTSAFSQSHSVVALAQRLQVSACLPDHCMS